MNDLSPAINSEFHALVYLLSATALLLAPGPTNTLLAAAGVGRGRRETFSLIAATLAGYLLAISGWGIVITSMENSYPWLSTAVRVVCSIYLLYVAAKIWMSTENPAPSRVGAIGPATVFMTTLLNPKGLLFASTIFPPQAFYELQMYVLTMVLFACLVVPIGMAWISVGTVVGSGRVLSLDPLKLQRALALVIVVFSATLVWTAIR